MNIYVLNNALVKLENERMFYDEFGKVLRAKIKKFQKDYRIGLKIYDFLCDSMEGENDLKTQQEKLKDLLSEKINDKTKIGDLFICEFDKETSELKYSLKISKDMEFYSPEKVRDKIIELNSAIKSIGEQTVVSCVQYFEEFFDGLLRNLMEQYPEKYFYDKKIDYKDVVQNSLSEIKDKVIGNEVYSMMHGVVDSVKKINDKHSLGLSNYNDLFEKYIEIDAHRDIIVHNFGKANKDYNDAVAKRFQKELGKYINIDDKYINDTIDNIEKFEFLLYYLCGKTDEEENLLEKIAFNFLCKEHWDNSLFFYDLLKRIKKKDNRILLMTYQVNYALAYKYLEGMEKAKEIIEEIDVSGMNDTFVIAKHLLLEENEDAFNILVNTYPNSFRIHSIIQWPIFKEFRKTEYFGNFIKKFEDDFNEYSSLSCLCDD